MPEAVVCVWPRIPHPKLLERIWKRNRCREIGGSKTTNGRVLGQRTSPYQTNPGGIEPRNTVERYRERICTTVPYTEPPPQQHRTSVASIPVYSNARGHSPDVAGDRATRESTLDQGRYQDCGRPSETMKGCKPYLYLFTLFPIFSSPMIEL